MIQVQVYRYNPEADSEPRMENYRVEDSFRQRMVLDVLEHLKERARLDGLYECILCGCCTSGCPSWWWNADKYLGPAVLLQAQRFLDDSRDTAGAKRLAALDDHYSVFRCRDIGNCVQVCPKGLNPMKAISDIRRRLLTAVAAGAPNPLSFGGANNEAIVPSAPGPAGFCRHHRLRARKSSSAARPLLPPPGASARQPQDPPDPYQVLCVKVVNGYVLVCSL